MLSGFSRMSRNWRIAFTSEPYSAHPCVSTNERAVAFRLRRPGASR
jgi:hypothetical protein